MTKGRQRWLALAGALLLVSGLASGCGGSAKPGAQGTLNGSASPTTVAANTPNPSQPTPTATLFDFNSTADCLDQFSGSGATRASADGADTASVAVPDDGNWDHFLSVEVYFFPNAAKAAGFAKHAPLGKSETVLTGNVVINGSAVATPYSRDLVLKCLKPA